MNNHELFDIWAPPESIWSLWAKPVLFACMSEQFIATAIFPTDLPPLEVPFFGGAALVIDYPGAMSVAMGLAAARAGYRPVPLFNAVPATPEGDAPLIGATVLDITEIMKALAAGAEELRALNLSPNAPPAFLLDANRRGRNIPLEPGVFDNRSVSFTTDFPSALFLNSQKINWAILMQVSALHPQPDLAHTLLKWQQGGLQIHSVNQFDQPQPQPIQIQRPSSFGLIWQRVLAAAGLRAHPLGGFGGLIPESSSG